MSPTSFPEPHFVKANGVRLAVYEQGEGIPVVFLHGFPELAFSWRYQFQALAHAGFRAIALDQRGCGASDCPEAIEDYDISHLTGDLAGLLDALEIDRAVFCGHDFGGMVVWTLGQIHAARTMGLIGLCTPFLARPPVAPLQLLTARKGPEHYIVHFQKPGDADKRLARDVRRVFEVLMRKDFQPGEVDRTRGIRNLATIVEEGCLPGKPLLSEDDLMVFVRAFERTGFTGGINAYRNLDRNWRITATAPREIPAPSLMVMAGDDFVLPPQMADGMETRMPNLEKVLIQGAGHWIQQEKPEELNRILIDWLRRQFPSPDAV